MAMAWPDNLAEKAKKGAARYKGNLRRNAETTKAKIMLKLRHAARNAIG
jgi:hypothetical protein